MEIVHAQGLPVDECQASAVVDGAHDLARFELDVGTGGEVDDVGAQFAVEPGGHVEVGGDQRAHVVRLVVEPVGDFDRFTGRHVDPFDGHRCVGMNTVATAVDSPSPTASSCTSPDAWRLPKAGCPSGASSQNRS